MRYEDIAAEYDDLERQRTTLSLGIAQLLVNGTPVPDELIQEFKWADTRMRAWGARVAEARQ